VAHPSASDATRSSKQGKRAEKNGTKRRVGYLVLVDAFDGDTLAGGAVDGGEGVAELAVAQQLAERVPRLDVLVVAKVRALPARHDPAAAVGLLLPRRGGAVCGSGGGGTEAHRTR
jgi:hypothetical protein